MNLDKQHIDKIFADMEMVGDSIPHDHPNRCKRKVVTLAYVEGKRTIAVLTNLALGDCSNEVGNCGCMHAEQHLVASITRGGIPAKQEEDRVLFINYSPCTNCANLLAASEQVDTVVYKIPTEHDLRGIDRLKQFMEVIHYDDIQ